MTTRFRIDQVRIETVNGPVTYEFPDDLTVLAGDTGVGKTTLLELIKFSLGGDGLVAPVAEQSVSEVHVSLRVGRDRYELTRALDEVGRKTVRVTDLITGDARNNVPLTGDDETVSDILMTALGLPTNMRAAARTTGNARKGSAITFYDLFRYMYVPQAAINQEIAGSRDKYYEPKRKAVFELLFGLTNPEILDMQSRLNQLNAQVTEAKREFGTVTQFLADSGTQTRLDAEMGLAAAISDERAGNAALEGLVNEVGEVIDRETQLLRELLADSENSLAKARELVSELTRESLQYRNERHQVELDISRLTRMADAGERLANIEFVLCPRCTQSLTQRQVAADLCRVCLQPDIVGDLPHGQYETAQLIAQVREIDQQLSVISAQAADAAEAVANRSSLVASLSTQIETRTANRVTPRLQAYTDAVAQSERAKAQQKNLEHVLQQWDRADDLGASAEQREAERAALDAQIRAAASELDQRKRDVLAQLSAEFQATVADFRIPGGQSASVDSKSYLPLLGGRPFNKVSSAGGIATATQVAYWVAMVTVATRLNDTAYPTFLMIDSPRLAVSSTEDIAGQMYARFVTQVGVTPGRLQFIVADNELPKDYAREFTELVFSYEQPTIGNVVHPGPADVTPLGDDLD